MVLIDNGDKRLPYAIDYLKKYDIKLGLESDNIVILPINGTNDLGFIKNTNIRIDDLYKEKPFDILITGQKNTYLENFMKDKGILVSYYDEALLNENSYYTALGLLGIIINNIDFSLKDKRILILGFGHSGKEITKILLPFTKNIDIYNRTDYRLEIEALDLNYLNQINGLDYDLIINTIPKKIIQGAPTCKIFDIASKKGFDEEIDVIHSLGIPNMMPIDAGISLGKAIERALEKIIWK